VPLFAANRPSVRLSVLPEKQTQGGIGLAVAEQLSAEGAKLLLNGAGISSARSLEALTDADWQAQWDIHVMAPMRLMRAAIPVMAAAGWGRVVNVSSSSGKRPGQRNVAYSVSKAAELSLSRAYADYYASRGVLVNAVTPGPVASELWLEPGGSWIRLWPPAAAPARRCSRRPQPACPSNAWPAPRRSPP
jgi:NAD(P)-dependent dehydrogenase (short-subunit alcohol dehydrogenase family)